MEFHTNRLICAPISPSDKQDYCSLYTDAKVMRKITTPLSPQQAEHNFEKIIKKAQERPNSQLCWSIKEADSAKFIGILALVWHTPRSADAEIGIVLKQQASGKNYPIEGMGALVDFGFSQLGLNKIFAHFHPSNKAVERFVSKLGFNVNQQINEGQLGPMKYCFIEKLAWLNSSQRIIAYISTN